MTNLTTPTITVSLPHSITVSDSETLKVGNSIIMYCQGVAAAGLTGDTPFASGFVATVKELITHHKTTLYFGRKVVMAYTTEGVTYSCDLFERKLNRAGDQFVETLRGTITVTATRPTYVAEPHHSID